METGSAQAFDNSRWPEESHPLYKIPRSAYLANCGKIVAAIVMRALEQTSKFLARSRTGSVKTSSISLVKLSELVKWECQVRPEDYLLLARSPYQEEKESEKSIKILPLELLDMAHRTLDDFFAQIDFIKAVKEYTDFCFGSMTVVVSEPKTELGSFEPNSIIRIKTAHPFSVAFSGIQSIPPSAAVSEAIKNAENFETTATILICEATTARDHSHDSHPFRFKFSLWFYPDPVSLAHDAKKFLNEKSRVEGKDVAVPET